MIKYLVMPDYIVSRNDGQFHYIDSEKLIKLYNVDRKECKIILSHDIDCRSIIYNSNLIELRPRYNGDYKIVKNN